MICKSTENSRMIETRSIAFPITMDQTPLLAAKLSRIDPQSFKPSTMQFVV